MPTPQKMLAWGIVLLGPIVLLCAALVIGVWKWDIAESANGTDVITVYSVDGELHTWPSPEDVRGGAKTIVAQLEFAWSYEKGRVSGVPTERYMVKQPVLLPQYSTEKIDSGHIAQLAKEWAEAPERRDYPFPEIVPLVGSQGGTVQRRMWAETLQNGIGLATVVGTPLWALFVLWSFGWGRRLCEAVRRRRGLCPKCGYPHSTALSRCPECGFETRSSSNEAARTAPGRERHS